MIIVISLSVEGKEEYRKMLEERRRKYEEEHGLVTPRPAWSPAARTIPVGR